MEYELIDNEIHSRFYFTNLSMSQYYLLKALDAMFGEHGDIEDFIYCEQMAEIITSYDNYYLCFPTKPYFSKANIMGKIYTDYDEAYHALPI